ncbi:MAG: peptide chain release factor-like protein [Geobacter sp.]|nr:peptide chain release factor-like protein [Geobacter sp.]
MAGFQQPVGRPVQTFAVSEEKNRQLREAMAALGIREEDLEERFVRSSGAGGQHVNKTATCVWLRHRHSGIEVKCMRDRSQSVNRFLARRELVERLAAQAGQVTPRGAEQEKLRRQKAKRRQKARRKYVAPIGEPHDQQ